MTRKRDGPAPFSATPSQGQKGDERPLPLPPPKILRKPGRTTSPQHRRVRRRPDDPSWREFRVRLVTKPGAEGAAALYGYLRAAAKRYGLEVVSVDEIHDDKSKVKKETDPHA